MEIDSKKMAQLVLVVLLCFCVCFQELVEIDSKKTAQLVLVVFIVFLFVFSGAG